MLSVWVLLPHQLELVHVHQSGEARYGIDGRLAADPALPDLTPEVASFFAQLRR